MIRVVVVDDEIKVCKLICGLVDWALHDMEIAGVAHNGIEALQMIEALQPDLVVTDIRMPGCDGLELIRRAKQIKENLDFIIISGYRHFEYAQNAMQYGVSDYLLKPIKKEELSATLERIKQKNHRDKMKFSQEEAIKIHMLDNIDRLRASFFFQLLTGEMGDQQKSQIEQINYDYHFNFQPGIYQMFIVKIDCEPERVTKEIIKVLGNKIVQILEELLKKECYEFELCIDDSRIYGIMNYEQEKQKKIRRQLKAGMDSILVQKGLYEKVEISIGLGSDVDRIEAVEGSFQEAEYSIKQRLVEGGGKLIETRRQGNAPVKPKENKIATNNELLVEWGKRTDTAVEVLDLQMLANALNQLKQGIEYALAYSQPSGESLLELVNNAYELFLLRLRVQHPMHEKRDDAKQIFEKQSDFCSSIETLFLLLQRTTSNLLATVLSDKKQLEKRPVRLAKQYILENYMKAVTLEEVAEYVGFNASYFSTLFKKESGQNFVEYLTEVRMSNAKALLKESKESVSNICKQVGYSDIKHFTQSFKKHTGLKPNEFRKLYA